MPKTFKVKRYRRIYRRPLTPLSIVIRCISIVLTVGLFGFIGWSAYGPVKDYFEGTLAASAEKHVPELSSSVVSGSSPESNINESDIHSSSPQPKPDQSTVTGTHAIYLPLAVITDEAKLEAQLEALSKTDINAVMFDIKNDVGVISYRSKLSSVLQTGAQAENAFDLKAFCEKLESHQLTPIGRLNAFRDTYAPGRMQGSAVNYMNTEVLWLDNSAENGGKPWLNPYSDIAQTYISDLAAEAVSLGVKNIVLDNVTFPSGYGLNYATYANSSGGVTRSEILSSFIDLVDKRVTDLGGEVSLYVSGMSAVGKNDVYYGGNPLTLGNGKILLGVMPAQFGDGFSFDDFKLDNPVTSPYETVSTLIENLMPSMSEMTVTAVIQGYNAPDTIQNNKEYTFEDITAQITALTENEILNYVIYSPDGAYTFP